MDIKLYVVPPNLIECSGFDFAVPILLIDPLLLIVRKCKHNLLSSTANSFSDVRRPVVMRALGLSTVANQRLFDEIAVRLFQIVLYQTPKSWDYTTRPADTCEYGSYWWKTPSDQTSLWCHCLSLDKYFIIFSHVHVDVIKWWIASLESF